MVTNVFPTCAFNRGNLEVIESGHGGGGAMMHELLDQVLPHFGEVSTSYEALDGAMFHSSSGDRMAFATDSYVVSPLFFPGGDIGRLAVNGTVNDLAMCGARAKVLSCSLIIEQGVKIETVLQVVQSMAKSARKSQVQIVTGDTKVVGTGSNLYVNTSGVGWMISDQEFSPKLARVGDKIILCGDIGRHAVAVMAARAGLDFNPPISSDTRPLSDQVEALLGSGARVRFMRDPTRGGLASSLVELAKGSGLGIAIDETSVVVQPDVKNACEVLGFDPMYLANEGCFIYVVAPQDVDKSLEALASLGSMSEASVIGEVTDGHPNIVVAKTAYGTNRLLSMAVGEQFPRIC